VPHHEAKRGHEAHSYSNNGSFLPASGGHQDRSNSMLPHRNAYGGVQSSAAGKQPIDLNFQISNN